MYLVGGALSVALAAISVFLGPFSVSGGVLGVPIGYGVLRRKPSWRRAAVVLSLAALLNNALSVIAIVRNPDEFTQYWDEIAGVLLGDSWRKSAAIGLAVYLITETTLLVAGVWVLSRQRVRRLFLQGGSPAHPVRTWLLIVAVLTVCRETGGLSTNFYTSTTSSTSFGVVGQGSDQVTLRDKGFAAPCAIEVRGLPEEILCVVDQFQQSESAGGTSTHYHWRICSGLAIQAVPSELRRSTDRIVVGVQQFELFGLYWFPLIKDARFSYRAEIRGEGKYDGYREDISRDGEFRVYGLCSVHFLKESLTRQVAAQALGKVLDSATKTQPEKKVPRQVAAEALGKVLDSATKTQPEKKVPEVFMGKAGATKAVALAQRCHTQNDPCYAAASRYYDRAFTADPTLLDDVTHRYQAACCAAMAGCGQGKDAKGLDAGERARLRRQSLAWLQSHLNAWSKRLADGAPSVGADVLRAMRHWQQDDYLCRVREKEELATLPAGEREAWKKLWTEVAALTRKAEGKK
jgi:hypothetical protein